MKTCPNPKCKTTSIPDDAKFCPNCGASLCLPKPAKRKNAAKSFLFGGTGTPSSIKGCLIVDIRQCRRTSGLGWDGMYEFSPGLPVGYTGFYAVFDESLSVQIRVEHGKISKIFFVAGDYELRVWRGEKEVSYTVIEGWWIFKDLYEKHRNVPVTYFGWYKKNVLLSEKDAEKEVSGVSSTIDKLLDKCDTTYKKESQDFFGMSWEQLMEHSEYFAF